MENSGRRRSNSYLIILTCILAVAAPLAAQTSRPAAARPSLPRTPDGHPDLQGTYDLATLTPLERPAGAKAVLTAEEAAKFEKGVAAQWEAAGRPIAGERSAPPKGGDGSTGPAGGVGGYNNFWLDPGSSFTIVNGERRTSLIVDPADGRVPSLTAAARQRQAAARIGRPTSDTTESRDPGLEPPGAGENLHVIERFRRVAPNALLYRFTIDDPETWVTPWTGEYTWPATDARIYEYACHESNYALENILRGARRREADEAEKNAK